MRLTLPTGRQLTITNLEFKWTYEGLLLGSPNPARNREHMESAVRRAKEARPWLPVQLLPSVTKEPECLPSTCWIISFLSGALPNSDEIWSALTVVWFTDYDPARPLVEQVKEAMRNIDWDGLAVAWEP